MQRSGAIAMLLHAELSPKLRCYSHLISSGEMGILLIQQVPAKSMPVMDRKFQRIWKLNSCRGNTILLPDFGSGPP
ncbi:hypothetical protein ACOSQ4_032719 [Xanthoceras sorbifolium]